MQLQRAELGNGRRRKVSTAIVRVIEGQIRRGDFKPGDRLPPERRLAQDFGTSRSSVREALRILELSGLIHSRHGEGNFIADTLPKTEPFMLMNFLEGQRANLVDLFEARKMFEPYVTSLAAERATTEDLEKIWTATKEGEHIHKNGDVKAAAHSDRIFHAAVAAAAGSETLCYLHSYLSDLISSGRREVLENDARQALSVVDHKKICKAISSHEPSQAREAMLQHLESVEHLVMQTVSTYQRAASLISEKSS
jgi:GntR family transcriptional repressor for pyruvate dehydrogenase complex